jgi:hypothetical protein
MTIILAVATIHAVDGTPAAGTLDNLAAQETASPNGRRLSGQTVAELRIRQPNRSEESIDDSTTVTISDVVPSATIGAGSNGGLRVTVPDPAGTISFARDDGGPFAGLSINAGATTLQGNLHVDGNVGINNIAPAHRLDVNGSINATDILRNGSSLVESKWDDANGGINFSGGRVGVGSAIPAATLDVAGAIKVSGGNTLLFHRTNEAGVPNGDGFRLRYEESFFGANQDALLIEKTDGNASDPDGGIAFVNTGNDGVVDTALAIKGNGFVGIGTTTPDRPLTIQGNGGRYLNVKANNGTHEVLLGADNAGGIVSTMLVD